MCAHQERLNPKMQHNGNRLERRRPVRKGNEAISLPPVRMAIIGYGFAGRCFHRYLIGLVPGLELRGIASRDPAVRARIRQELNCQVYESFEAVLTDPGVEAVVLATPNSTHADMAIAALRAGKHVVTDKIMALTEADCLRMIEESRRAGKLLTVFQNRRWDGDFLTVKRLLEEGRLGDLRWLEMSWQSFGPPRNWRSRREMGGGKLYDLGAHLADQTLLLLREEPRTVYARLQYDWPGVSVESHAQVIIGFESGRTAVLDVSAMSAIPKPRFHVFGAQGTFRKFGLDPQEPAMIAGNIDAAREDPAFYGRFHDGRSETVIPTIPGRWRSFYENFADAVRYGEPLAVDPRQVVRSVRLIEAAFVSAWGNRVVTLPPSPSGNGA